MSNLKKIEIAIILFQDLRLITSLKIFGKGTDEKSGKFIIDINSSVEKSISIFSIIEPTEDLPNNRSTMYS